LNRGTAFSVREDYTERVQLQRRELGQNLVQARNSGQNASIRYDKLIVDISVYKYDDLTNQITRIGSTRVRGERVTGPRNFRRETGSHDTCVSDGDQSGSEGGNKSEASGEE
jgi:hypothetical protein